MSTFYGQVVGSSATTASRRGTQISGIRSSAQSWNGSVIVYMHGDGIVDIEIAEGSALYGKTYFSGTIEELKEVLKK